MMTIQQCYRLTNSGREAPDGWYVVDASGRPIEWFRTKAQARDWIASQQPT